MKKIEAIIKPFKLDVKSKKPFTTLAFMDHRSRSQGLWTPKGHTELYRGVEGVVDFLPKVKIEVVIDDAMTERVVDAIQNAAQTEELAMKIFISSIDEAIGSEPVNAAPMPFRTISNIS